MKKFFIILGGVFFIFGFSANSFASSLKIGYVNTIEVFNEYQLTIDKEEELEGKKDKVKQSLQVKEDQIRESQQRLGVLREDQLDAEREKLQKKIMEYRELREKELTDITQKRDVMMRNIVEDIDQSIKEYARDNGYDFILDGSTLLFGPEDSDLTDEILRRINQEYGRR